MFDKSDLYLFTISVRGQYSKNLIFYFNFLFLYVNVLRDRENVVYRKI